MTLTVAELTLQLEQLRERRGRGTPTTVHTPDGEFDIERVLEATNEHGQTVIHVLCKKR